ncbi:Indole-3-glycerol phosphate synthase [Richelia intracellularis HH01]|uniref:Indole-3-glycerol phosphate synthase n=1 Tax=Richelia intracellularis HH01 TaxID=1165094 RepID=M1X6B7_9NOST|nr:indole-3-glycerol phosphate synthase TrpC [Richelia intracellularis]CCH68026.1 Indole-3-glycerol phosphate synthase [Richelia intracellularis HH01]HAE06478.1 indole-3-glycerol phosphate synthase TrpC [Richelia sp.]
MYIRRRQPNPVIAASSVQYQVALPDAAPKNILEAIVWNKELEVDQQRLKQPLQDLQSQIRDLPTPKDFLATLKQGKTKPALIAEVKKASPIQGVLCEDFNPTAIASEYQSAGASCISVVTDKKFFHGDFNYLAQIHTKVDLPLLCKDFIIYPYQIYLARSKGADAVLLIAAILSNQDLQYFIKITNLLRMTPLVEVHTLEEIDRVLTLDGVVLVSINNRELEDFSVNLHTTCQLLAARAEELRKKGVLVISESGLKNREDINLVQKAGASAVLIGELLIKHPDRKLVISNLLTSL